MLLPRLPAFLLLVVLFCVATTTMMERFVPEHPYYANRHAAEQQARVYSQALFPGDSLRQAAFAHHLLNRRAPSDVIPAIGLSVVLLIVGLLYAPCHPFVVRRRYRLQRLEGHAAEAVRQTLQPLLAKAPQIKSLELWWSPMRAENDAFVFGPTAAPALALSGGTVMGAIRGDRNTALVLCHEMGHVVAGDSSVTYASIGLWVTYLSCLVVTAFTVVGDGLYHNVGEIYRLLYLFVDMLLMYLGMRVVLRQREFAADRFAVAEMPSFLDSLSEKQESEAWWKGLVRRLLDTHPTLSSRRHAILLRGYDLNWEEVAFVGVAAGLIQATCSWKLGELIPRPAAEVIAIYLTASLFGVALIRLGRYLWQRLAVWPPARMGRTWIGATALVAISYSAGATGSIMSGEVVVKSGTEAGQLLVHGWLRATAELTRAMLVALAAFLSMAWGGISEEITGAGLMPTRLKAQATMWAGRLLWLCAIVSCAELLSVAVGIHEGLMATPVATAMTGLPRFRDILQAGLFHLGGDDVISVTMLLGGVIAIGAMLSRGGGAIAHDDPTRLKVMCGFVFCSAGVFVLLAIGQFVGMNALIHSLAHGAQIRGGMEAAVQSKFVKGYIQSAILGGFIGAGSAVLIKRMPLSGALAAALITVISGWLALVALAALPIDSVLFVIMNGCCFIGALVGAVLVRVAAWPMEPISAGGA